jgi:hypothetical protein
MSEALGQGSEFHRKTAEQCFNKTWDLLEKKNRTPQEDEQMLHLAHASRYHWGLVGTSRNLAVGEWQVSRVYADLKQGEPALLFAKSSLDLCIKNNLSDLLPSAYEGMARAYAIADQPQLAKDFVAKARKELESTKDEEDRKLYANQINETEALIQPSQIQT